MPEPKTYPLSEIVCLKLENLNLKMQPLEQAHAPLAKQKEEVILEVLKGLNLEPGAADYFLDTDKRMLTVRPKQDAPAVVPIQKQRRKA